MPGPSPRPKRPIVSQPLSERGRSGNSSPKREAKAALHPRNPHQGRYDFAKLTAACPELGRFAKKNPEGEPTIDFTDPAAVRMLNRALLAAYYGIEKWEIPDDYLCPPVPGRADAIHHLADLLSEARGKEIRVLDIGVGASAIYPIIGHHAYGWSFVGSDIDPAAIASARRILKSNPALAAAVELRRQPEPEAIFRGVIRAGERFDLSLCNPPFHASLKDARQGSARKWTNLGRPGAANPVLNFGGKAVELSCEGGEEAFVGRMIAESVRFAGQVGWFSSLVSQEAHLAGLLRAVEQAGARDVRVQEMEAGQKKSRILAWTFAG